MTGIVLATVGNWTVRAVPVSGAGRVCRVSAVHVSGAQIPPNPWPETAWLKEGLRLLRNITAADTSMQEACAGFRKSANVCSECGRSE